MNETERCHRVFIRVILDFGSCKSGIQPIFWKSGSGQISSWIWQIPVQLLFIQLITDKTNAADLSSGVLAILIGVTQTIKIQNLFPFHKLRQKLANNDAIEEALNCTASL